MDHEVVPCSSKICDWLLNLSWDHFGLHQAEEEKKIVRVTMELEVPEKAYFPVLHYPSSWSHGFCSGRGKRGFLVANVKGPLQRFFFFFFDFFFKMLPNIFHSYDERREEEGEKVKHEGNSQIHFLVHGHFSWSTSGLHLVRGPKALRMHFL